MQVDCDYRLRKKYQAESTYERKIMTVSFTDNLEFNFRDLEYKRVGLCGMEGSDSLLLHSRLDQQAFEFDAYAQRDVNKILRSGGSVIGGSGTDVVGGLGPATAPAAAPTTAPATAPSAAPATAPAPAPPPAPPPQPALVVAPIPSVRFEARPPPEVRDYTKQHFRQHCQMCSDGLNVSCMS